MNYHEILKATIFCFIIFLFIIFFWFFTQIFSGSLEQFFVWKIAYSSQSFLSSVQNSALNIKQAITPQNLLPLRDWQAADLKINAQSSISAQINSKGQKKVLFENNGDKKLLIASLTKLMTAAVVLENYDLTQKVVVSKEDVEQGGFLKVGDILIVKDLLNAMLIGSDNSAAYALSKPMGKEKFVALMNKKAAEFGLKNTYYTNSVGFGLKNLSSSEDLVELTYRLLNQHPEIFQITALTGADIYNANGSLNYKSVNTDEFLTDQSLGWENTIVGSKTGNNEIAGECLVLVLKSPDSDGYLINVVLNSKDRFGDMKKIINWVNTAYKWK